MVCLCWLCRLRVCLSCSMLSTHHNSQSPWTCICWSCFEDFFCASRFHSSTAYMIRSCALRRTKIRRSWKDRHELWWPICLQSLTLYLKIPAKILQRILWDSEYKLPGHWRPWGQNFMWFRIKSEFQSWWERIINIRGVLYSHYLTHSANIQ